MPAPENSQQNALRRLGQLIREAREDAGWTQDQLAEQTGIGRATIQRYENARSPAPEFDKVRALVLALDVDPREILVALGLSTRDEAGLPPQRPRPRRLDPTTEEILTLLEHDRVPHAQKLALRDMLRAQLDAPPAADTRAG